MVSWWTDPFIKWSSLWFIIFFAMKYTLLLIWSFQLSFGISIFLGSCFFQYHGGSISMWLFGITNCLLIGSVKSHSHLMWSFFVWLGLNIPSCYLFYLYLWYIFFLLFVIYLSYLSFGSIFLSRIFLDWFHFLSLYWWITDGLAICPPPGLPWGLQYVLSLLTIYIQEIGYHCITVYFQFLSLWATSTCYKLQNALFFK